MTIEGPTKVQTEVKDNGDGTYSFSFAPEEAGICITSSLLSCFLLPSLFPFPPSPSSFVFSNEEGS